MDQERRIKLSRQRAHTKQELSKNLATTNWVLPMKPSLQQKFLWIFDKNSVLNAARGSISCNSIKERGPGAKNRSFQDWKVKVIFKLIFLKT